MFEQRWCENEVCIYFIVLTEGTKVMNYDDIYNFSLSDWRLQPVDKKNDINGEKKLKFFEFLNIFLVEAKT